MLYCFGSSNVAGTGCGVLNRSDYLPSDLATSHLGRPNGSVYGCEQLDYFALEAWL